MPPTSSRSSAGSRRVEIVFLAGLALLGIVVLPALNSGGLLGDHRLNLLGQCLCYGLLAVSVDLLWGYVGVLSLGQALFFTVGGYVVALHLTAATGAGGTLPGHLAGLGRTRLPDWWQSFASWPVTLAAATAFPALIALVFGFPAFRSRINSVYFAIATQALSLGAMTLLQQLDLLGGRTGLQGFTPGLGGSGQWSPTPRLLFAATAAALVVAGLFCRWLNGTRFGLVLRALRDGESRVLASGYASASYKLFAFVLAAIIAGFGGALFLPQAGGINPESLAPDRSLEAVVWVVVGGRGTLWGPALAAIGFSLLRFWVARHCPELWSALLGGIFVVFLLWLPGGLASLPGRLAAFGRRIGSKPASKSPPVGPGARA